MSPFVTGMPVICILPDTCKWQVGYGEIEPQAGAIYTVRTVECCVVDDAAVVFLRLREIVNQSRPYVDGYTEPMWEASGFRPLTSRETTIHALKSLTPDTPIADTPDGPPLRRTVPRY